MSAWSDYLDDALEHLEYVIPPEGLISGTHGVEQAREAVMVLAELAITLRLTADALEKRMRANPGLTTSAADLLMVVITLRVMAQLDAAHEAHERRN